MNRCAGYHTYTQDIGACDTKEPSSTCVTESPATTTWLQTAQSYKSSSAQSEAEAWSAGACATHYEVACP
eukprot:CAMPEP_0175433408 /NCGR_PEP_ID=MMETSP0095-20121207/53380_1 /TAXON_ID=311494 /ORGANISM="Alexandrium monilatum, Strain CCMP3105" /LENGTH=69 /DNA_ID=CAMNT_0016732931 /DNA_START=1 /DNA_END=207 /DNA_ORIENTATION=-